MIKSVSILIGLLVTAPLAEGVYVTKQVKCQYKPACNQKVYDEIYKRIIQEALKSKLNRKAITYRNDSIEVLRELCQGQKSSYEGGGK